MEGGIRIERMEGGGVIYPVQPDMKTMSPLTTAREYPIWDSKGEPEDMSLRDILSERNW